MKLSHALIILILIITGSVAFAENRKVTGLFSTFDASAKSGDISGAEIHVVPNPAGFSAIVQASEGAPGFPEVIDLNVNGTKIEFSIPENSASGFPPGKYFGTVTRKGLTLNGPVYPYKDYFMPRTDSFWQ